MKQDNVKSADNLRLVVFGTPDFGKPRTRILINGLRVHDVVAAECAVGIWRGVEDKSQVKGLIAWLTIALRYCFAYPVVIFHYLRAPRHDAVFVTYMGHLDVLILWPFAKLRGAKIVWDAFLSLHGTIVEDRKLIGAGLPLSWAVRLLETLSCAAADIVILDTESYAEYFRTKYKLRRDKVISVWVGAEAEFFHRAPQPQVRAKDDEFNILFYGQFIPLHGVEFIIDAIARTSDPSIKWTIIGRGQERAKIDALINGLNLPTLRLIDWVDYEELPNLIAKSDLCLGVFGVSDKATRVIPNKVFQILAMGKPFVTADTPAIREIVTDQTPGVWLVPPGSGAALADAVRAAKEWKYENGNALLFSAIETQISPEAVVQSLLSKLEQAFDAALT